MAIYAIKPKGTDHEPRYINAANKAQAIAYVAKQAFDVSPLRVAQIIAIATSGRKIEQAVAIEEDAQQELIPGEKNGD